MGPSSGDNHLGKYVLLLDHKIRGQGWSFHQKNILYVGMVKTTVNFSRNQHAICKAVELQDICLHVYVIVT